MKMNRLSPIFFLSIVVLFLFSACSTAPSFDNKQLIGTWEITEATRNGKKTGSLANSFFTFNENGTMETNLSLTGEIVKGNYLIEGTNIKETGANNLTYKIEALNPEQLDLAFNLRDMDFKISMQRKTVQKDIPETK